MSQMLPSRAMFGIWSFLVLILRLDLANSSNITDTMDSRYIIADSKATKGLRGSRLLSGSTITSPNCNMPRIEDYPAELQLFYTYSVEINDDILLYDMERAIDNAVVIELDMCDFMGRPVYKVRTSTSHSFSTSETCDPVLWWNTCIVVNGETSVLLDEVSDANFVRERVYKGILHGLGDVAFLNGFTNSIVSATFLAEGHATLVENRENLEDSEVSYPSGITTTVAVAAASVTIVVASIFCYGFVRRPNSRDPSVRHRNRSRRKPNTRPIVNVSQLGVPMRRHFVRLEDLSSSPSSFVTTSISPRCFSDVYNEIEEPEYPGNDSEEEYYTEVDCNPAINWSVSDITTDSASLRSGVSRTPSALERIEEEIEDEDIEDDDDCNVSVDDDGINADGDEEDRIEEEEDGSDDKSCNFSYSEDSTIITRELSKAGIVSEDDCEDDDVDDKEKLSKQNVANFDCASERQDCVLDISDLDPCFTILPENTEEVFCDLEDLSSEGTQDSPLESMLLEVRLSMDDSDSFKTATSDATMISLPQFETESIADDCHRIPVECHDSDRSESSTLKSLISVLVEDHSALDSTILSTPLEENEDSISFYTPLKEIPVEEEEITASLPSQDEIIHMVSDSDEGSVESEVDGSDDISTSSDCPENNAKEKGISSTTVEDDEDLATKICSVDSIDEWVNELMSQEPIETAASSITEI